VFSVRCKNSVLSYNVFTVGCINWEHSCVFLTKTVQLYCTQQNECSAVVYCSVLEMGLNYIVLWKFCKVCCPWVQISPARKWRIAVHSWRNRSFSIWPGCELNIIIVKAKVKVKSEAGYGVGVLRNAVFVPGSESESPFWARLRLRARTTPWLYTEPSTTWFRPVYSSCAPFIRI